MYKALILLTIIFVFCNDPNSKVKTFEFGSFKIQAPYAWQTIDTVTTFDTTFLNAPIKIFKWKIKVGTKDTINFELSMFAQIHQEYGFLVGPKDTTIFLTNNPDDTADDNRYWGYPTYDQLPKIVNSMYSDVNVNGRSALLFKPVHPGIGVTGIQFDSLWQENESTVRFALSGKNLSPSAQDKLLDAIKTIKF